ncbi:MAG: 4-hydroxythreonine-4-phosphate dehydrogenase PdxA [Gammaproteobacteria bacterium]|nr:4-hydroxythreonine-4-phosphate dehydrogenase PdxA [Gammaproteobacteria bacterium]
MTPTIAITTGEPAGIGPDVCVKAAMQAHDAHIVFIADPAIIETRAALLEIDVEIREHEIDKDMPRHQPGIMQILSIKAPYPPVPGELNPGNGSYVIEIIDKAVDLCKTGHCDAMVTASVQKSVINQSGIPFTGHTEWIADRTGANHPVMMLANQKLRVCLATIHVPLAQVPKCITRDSLCRVIEIIHCDMQKTFGLENPRIAVCGLNPHAGESGLLGSEEIEILEPAIASLRQGGISVVGPIPADTAFTPRNLGNCDVVLAMYHDQGLPVIKHSGFGEVVNITLGLPIIRTSVDHGTALDLAGTGKAEHSSLCAALDMAIDLSRRRSSQN